MDAIEYTRATQKEIDKLQEEIRQLKKKLDILKQVVVVLAEG